MDMKTKTVPLSCLLVAHSTITDWAIPLLKKPETRDEENKFVRIGKRPRISDKCFRKIVNSHGSII